MISDKDFFLSSSSDEDGEEKETQQLQQHTYNLTELPLNERNSEIQQHIAMNVSDAYLLNRDNNNVIIENIESFYKQGGG